MKLVLGAAAALAAAFALATPAEAQASYVTIDGKTKLRTDNNSKTGDRLDLVNVEYSLDVPVDAASGMAAGRRRHSPFTFTFRPSVATQQLYSALISGEALKVEYVTEVAPPVGTIGSTAGAVGARHIITLTNARVVSYKLVDQNEDAAKVDPLIKVKVVFQKIDYQVTGNTPGATVSDTTTP